MAARKTLIFQGAQSCKSLAWRMLPDQEREWLQQLPKSFSEQERMKFIREILQYLVEHADAMDTSEGIVQWWLPPGSAYPQEQVQEILNELVGRGWLTTRGSIEEFRVYGLNKESMQEVLEFLAKRDALNAI
jgi:hypothetical protein